MPTFGSLFAGIGGADVGLERAGWTCAWQVEIDPACTRVLTRHWPDVPQYGDISTVDGTALAPVDLIVFGSPCQDLSVAGKRAGLGGARSGLFYEAVRVVRAVRPAFALFENVPGLLSSHGGRDFAVVLRSLAAAGALDIAWRILDAQWFGLAQRRRRLFVVADFRGERAAAVLFEPESGSGHPAPRREAGARVAASLVGGAGSPRSHGKVNGENADVNLVCADTQSVGANQTTGFVGEAVLSVAHALSAHGPRLDPNGEDFLVTHALTAQHGCTEDGTGRGTPLVASLAHTLRAGGADASEDGTGRGVPLVVGYGVSENQRAECRLTDIARQITTGGGKPGQGYPAVLAFHQTQDPISGDVAPSLGATSIGMGAQQGPVVRRLTPVECERLQGFADDWTAGESDSTRYRMLGNAMAVPVLEWLGRRLREALDA